MDPFLARRLPQFDILLCGRRAGRYLDEPCSCVARTKDTGPLTKKRMETVDDETSNAAIDFIKGQAQANRPFFCWWNGTRMHLYTHVRPEYKGRSGLSEYMDGMLEHSEAWGCGLSTTSHLPAAGLTGLLSI